MQNHDLAIPQLQDEEAKRVQLDRMKFRASGLLVVAALIYIVARILEERYPWMGYVRATAEAGMVGGIADWFAVTALFRYPLGIPIPHTAIVPSRKDKIGASLGRFVENNFLSREVVVHKLRSVGAARRLAEWLARPENAHTLSQHTSAAIAGLVQVLRDDDVQELIDQSITTRVRKTQVAPLMGKVLEVVTAENRHQDLLNAALRLIARLVDENRDVLRQRIGDETPWWFPDAVDDKIYSKVAAGIDHTIHEVSVDPDHPLRARFNEAVDEFVEKLRTSPEMIARGEELKEEVLLHPTVRSYSASLWGDMKESLLRHNADPESPFRQRVERAVTAFGESLQDDPELLEKVEGWIEGAVLYVVEQYRHEVADLISTTVAAWPAEDTSRKIELQIGKDLQFIRINGTLVGGLAGLLIYTISRFFGAG
ncbi:MAG TPA: DUF445 domain-containing protein [Longimicrobiaceae bacterium]|nr:DUF445 domain-containing protein [Longimicrobiaceae bacterium]